MSLDLELSPAIAAFPSNTSSTTPSNTRSTAPSNTRSTAPLPFDRIETPLPDAADPSTTTKYGMRFWLIFTGLVLSALVSALEGSIVSTALPTISHTLHSGENYIWVINVYFLTSAAFQPLVGQFADLWGRRWLMISSVAIFTLASGICGGANNTATLIVGRAIQGVGAGGINMLVDLIICDLVPLRERGSIVGLLFSIISLTSSIGPLVGGLLAQHNFRWVFYLNLPIGGLAIITLYFYLRLSHRQGFTFKERIKQIDFIGNGILITATTLILYVLTYAGTKYSWANPHIITLFVVGFAAYGIFAAFENSRFCRAPVMPPRLFRNRTSLVAFFISFLHSVLTIWTVYFFPLYFQSVLGSTPTRSGVQLLPLVFVFPSMGAVAGVFVAKTGRYRPVHALGFGTLTIAIGLSSLLGPNSSTAAWVLLEIFVGLGLGLVASALLPAVQAELDEKETAASTATWAFIRSLGIIWGVAIPAAVFNNRFEEISYRIEDASVRAQLSGGRAYEHASKKFIYSFTGSTRDQLVDVYADSLKRSWQIGVIFAGISFLATPFMKEVKLRTHLETDFGIEGEDMKSK